MRYSATNNAHKSHRLIMTLAFLIVVSLGVAGYRFFHTSKTVNQANVTSAPTAANQPTNGPTAVIGRYLLNGTVTWARAVEQEAHGDFGQPFSMLNTFNRDQYDAWSTDFECPITNNVVPYQTQISRLVFNCRPEFLPAAVKYFTIFDLANNHSGDQGGEAGLEETRANLEKAGVQYFGTFDPSDSQNVCELLSLPVRIQMPDNTEQKSALPVAFCGWHYFNRPDVRPGELEVMDKYTKFMPVFAFAEMGQEYHAQALPPQVAIAHSIVDRNPEFLIANNPHWVQNTEVYKGKLIVYSTGNFIFDQLDSETNRSDSIDVTMTVPYDDNVAKWIALAPECKKFHDDCLAKAQQEGLSKIKLQLKYGVVAGQNGYKVITHKADAPTQKSVEERLNWAATLQALGQTSP
ncbi:MAG TPA: CapA family protein [Candidatus Limnocylindrales bacterium]|nr:CapA family protein [Candidatus Limnocylindrales bacterium]